MAAIGTIRKYSGIAVGLIGLSILAFIVSDAFNDSATGGLFKKKNNLVGIIGGDEITVQTFQARIEEAIERYKQNNQVDNVDESVRTQIQDDLWNQLVDEIIFGKELDKLDITVGADEMTFIITGPDPHPSIKQAFTDPKTGVFDRANVIQFLKTLDQREESVRNMWLEFENSLVKERNRQKYNELIKGSMYVTDLEAQNLYYAKNKFATFDYLALPLKTISDSTIAVTDKDIKKIYEKLKKQYPVEESRSFDYVVFDILPTKKDSADLMTQLAGLAKEFKASKNDSLYVEVNSDVHFDTLFHPRGFFPENLEKVFFDSPQKDSVVGPYMENNKYRLAKLITAKADTIFRFKASHILIKPEGTDTAKAIKRAREIMAKIQKSGNFADTAMKYSQDNGSAVKGGDLGWFVDGSMVKPFMDAVRRGKKGDMVIVKTQFGAHIIKITENKSNQLVKVGIIEKSIEASSETYQAIYNLVIKYRSKVNNAAEFEKVIKEQGLNKKTASDIKPNDKQIPGMNNSKKLINWVFNSKLNDVSDIIEMENVFVVANITKTVKKGFAPMEDIKEDLKNKVIKEKKLDMLSEKLEEASKSSTTLDGIAKATKATIDKITNASLNVPVITGLGEEKYLLGYVYGIQQGKLSPPIKGENAVFMIVLKEFSKVETPKNFKETKTELYNNYQGGMAQYQTYESLKEVAKVQDWRYRFY